MSERTFNVMDSVQISWKKVKGAKILFWCGFGLIILLQIAVTSLTKSHVVMQAVGLMALFWGLLKLVLTILAIMMDWSLFYIGLQVALGKKIHFGMLSYGFDLRLLCRMVGIYFFETLVLLIPILLLILPMLISEHFAHYSAASFKAMIIVLYGVGFVVGIYLAYRMFFSKLITIVNKSGPISSIKQSFNLSQSNVLKLLWLTVLNILILMLSLIPLGIGLIWTIPYVFINYGVVLAELTEPETLGKQY